VSAHSIKIIYFIVAFSFFFESKAQQNTFEKAAALSFKENKGQISDQFFHSRKDILCSGKSGSLVFHLRDNGISYQIYKINEWKDLKQTNEYGKVPHRIANKYPSKISIYRLDIDWLNINSNAIVLREDQVDGYDNYYSEVCPAGITGVKSHKNITYKNLYNGIDLKWYEKAGNLKYDFILAPGIDHKQICFEIKGADKVSMGGQGELIIQTPLGTLTEKAPYVTQNGKVLEAKWLIHENSSLANHQAQNSSIVVSFDILNVDATKQLVIDPLVRYWGTYSGDTDYDEFYGSSVDPAGNIYASGYSNSLSNIATSGAHQTVLGDLPADGLGDATLFKYNAAGAKLWATYYGGRGEDYASRCAVDATGNYVAMAGTTSSTLMGVIATTGAHQTIYGGNADPAWGQFTGDAFLAVFDNAGIRQWGTYYGGNIDEWGGGCSFDPNGNVYLCGIAESSIGVTIATPGSHQPAYGGSGWDGFLVKFNSSGTRLWGTYYGGGNYDGVYTCTTNISGDVLITGWSQSKNNISTLGAIQGTISGPYYFDDGIIVKFNSAGVRQWGTYYGTYGSDETENCVFDGSGNIYVAGRTTAPGAPNSPQVATTGSHQDQYGGGAHDAFLLKLDPGGARLWCTCYGGTGDEEGPHCAVDPAGNVYLMGTTTSTNAISTSCAYQENLAGVNGDTYLVKFDLNGKRIWGTYYGDTGSENYCTGSVDASGNIFLVGSTGSAGTAMASSGAHQATYGGGDADGFIAKFDGCISKAPNTTDPANLIICGTGSTALTTSLVCGIKWFDAAVGGIVIGTNSLFTTPILNSTSTFYVSDESCGTTTIRTVITVSVGTTPTVFINIPNTMLCASAKVDLTASGATSYTWSGSDLSCINCADPVASPKQTSDYCVTGTNDNFCFATACASIEVNSSANREFSFPSAFTPNGDGINDIFCLQGWNVCNDSFTIKIFDRWGEKVFESNDPAFCWDGIYKGQLLNGDVFAYSVNATYKDETKVNKKGDITLIR
jgi:gliding motility-associated-like protein